MSHRDPRCPLSVELLFDGMKIRSNLSQQISISKKIKLKIEVEKSEFSRHKCLIKTD